jgi:GNAT superfamily N-acetyltransferase
MGRMEVRELSLDLISQVQELMDYGFPFIRKRTDSDYWLYSQLFASSCPVAMINDEVAGAIIAFRSQTNADDVYIQDVITHPKYRKQGVSKVLLTHLQKQAVEWGCARIYLTSEPNNTIAHRVWLSLGFTNLLGDIEIEGISVFTDFKGPGKDRAVYQLALSIESK